MRFIEKLKDKNQTEQQLKRTKARSIPDFSFLAAAKNHLKQGEVGIVSGGG